MGLFKETEFDGTLQKTEFDGDSKVYVVGNVESC
jgi:hypothetical protein